MHCAAEYMKHKHDLCGVQKAVNKLNVWLNQLLQSQNTATLCEGLSDMNKYLQDPRGIMALLLAVDRPQIMALPPQACDHRTNTAAS